MSPGPKGLLKLPCDKPVLILNPLTLIQLFAVVPIKHSLGKVITVTNYIELLLLPLNVIEATKENTSLPHKVSLYPTPM